MEFRYRRYLNLGIAESNPIIGDLNALLKDTRISANGNLGTDSILNPLLKSLGKTGELGQKGVYNLQKNYTQLQMMLLKYLTLKLNLQEEGSICKSRN
jgi:hypothetical protein